MIQENNGKVISSPRLITENNKYASFFSGEKIPYFEKRYSSSGNERFYRHMDDDNYYVSSDMYRSSTEYDYARSAISGISLSVHPHINADNSISMTLNTSVNSLTGFSPTNEPIVFSRSTQTYITVNDGETFVVGGLRKRVEVSGIRKFPVLGYIPILGYLFQKKYSTFKNNEIIMFITPKVISTGSNLSAEDKEEIKVIDAVND